MSALDVQMRGVLLAGVLVGSGVADAQPIAGPATDAERGNRLLDEIGAIGATLRASATAIGTAEAIGIDDRAPGREEFEHFQRWQSGLSPELRDALAGLHALDDQALLDIAHALCKTTPDSCDARASYVAGALRCAAGGCAFALPPDDEHTFRDPTVCIPVLHRVRMPRLGFGAEVASGWQDSGYRVDGRAWSIGFEVRRRVAHRWGMFARIDRSSGRDESRDAGGDGRDDDGTGAVTRVSVAAGPSIVLFQRYHDGAARYLQLDLGAGLLETTSQDGEAGPIGVADLSYQLSVLRFGVRAMQGLGDASTARSVLAHAGFSFGGGPEPIYGVGCDERRDGSRWAVGLDLPIAGWGAASELGYVPPGFGVEIGRHLSHRFDALVHADLIVFTGGDRERVIQHALLAGGRVDFSSRSRGSRSGAFATLLAGYALTAGPEPSAIQSGPVVDVSLGWGPQAPDGQAWVRLHGRFGVSPDNRELRAFFVSIGGEVRLDDDQWEDRR